MYNFDKLVYTDDFMWEELGVRELPNSLFHYTSVDTLEKIITNKSIRFNRLDKVNDPEEALTANLENANTLVFVSCWDDERNESIHMWNMYGDNFKGVRIELPIDMFKGRDNIRVYEKGGAMFKYAEMIDIDRKDFSLGMRTSSIFGPNKVAYVDNRELLISKAVYEESDFIHVNLYDLGLFKNKYWHIENEWRYKIIGLMEEVNYPNDAFTRDILDLKRYPVNQTEIFVQLDESVFKEMKITVGPKCNEDDYTKLIHLSNLYNCKLEKSIIQIR
ncbi:DUF2971 domain-containing protein [Lysinibacillus endophyticus]|uniref:DUF2971 domain-containing protein n=1 Tax=Ureibacillus endophyticus TaxID=1978490 RepID=UPI00209F94E4|nr:DUF2971 domain-containing protein [Lysinibacillus endophyticus]MCP1145787.1 DUF2971 domain-containing protein [Lysinibacillus endophyticus]